MADAAQGSLSDFFNKKNKKKIKGSNLNNQTADKKTEAKKVGKKDAEEEGWEEEQVVANVMKVEVAGKLIREEEKKDEEDSAAPAWGSLKSKDSNLNDKKFPTLAKSAKLSGMSSNINLDDGSSGKINIETSKNAFSALEVGQDSDDEGSKRPKEIKPAMVQKKKGESEKHALQREVNKYEKAKKKAAKKGEKDDEEASESEEEESEGEQEVEKAAAKEKKAKKPAAKKAAKKDESEDENEQEEAPQQMEEDLKVQPDLAASKAKYEGRRKLPRKELPADELEENKENRPKQQQQGGGKKKKIFVEEEDDKAKRLQVWED
eukprot:TRINITY_DN72722_c0_g1_i1.p1 TRINITY_DN72722_c0_g1~~TRINITY_DN72722_c0_g1_i1.p1  ORF type:complete len:320 (+),score=162.99 TRINITY_DN72722_c0_g1_i1:62-1021(+)